MRPIRLAALLACLALIGTACTSGGGSDAGRPLDPRAATASAAAPSEPAESEPAESGPAESEPADGESPSPTPAPSITASSAPAITDEQGVADLIVSDAFVAETFPRYRMDAVNLTTGEGPANWAKASVVRPRACRPLVDGPGASVKPVEGGPIAWWAESAWDSRETDPDKLNLFPMLALFQGVAVYSSASAAEEAFARMADQANADCRRIVYTIKGVGTNDNDYSTLEYDPGDQVITLLDPGSVLQVITIDGDRIVYGSIIGSNAKSSQIRRLTAIMDESVAQGAGQPTP